MARTIDDERGLCHAGRSITFYYPLSLPVSLRYTHAYPLTQSLHYPLTVCLFIPLAICIHGILHTHVLYSVVMSVIGLAKLDVGEGPCGL